MTTGSSDPVGSAFGLLKSAFSKAAASVETVRCAVASAVDSAATSLGLKPAPLAQSMEKASKEVNPDGGSINCGYIIDAVYKRLRGVDPAAVAESIETDGTWAEINDRYNTSVKADHAGKAGFQKAFEAVEQGGDGTIGIIRIDYNDPAGSGHVVLIANEKGKVGIIEGQGGGKLIKSASEANSTYNAGGASTVGYDIIPPNTKL